ncbi:hypothetical protein [Phenylobacterium sp.]|uniref:hypothetical protein n=1 Tax=Phenylobacterium sp. TaxID=1871053 RepID=UPI002DF2D64F|nr:hypothetical protein [Phenylobacterium sp.]
MRAALLALALMSWTGAALAQPAPQGTPPPTQEPPQGEPDAAAEPPAPAAPGARINPNASTEAYDSRVRQSFAAAESFQGRLDGGWTASARGRDLLQLQLVDKGKGQVEGAWRDLLGGLSASASGLIDPVAASGDSLDLSFRRADGLVFRLTVHAGPDGRWSGKLWRGDELFDVALRRSR